ncbi:MAG: hypothetical protein ACE14S_02290 [Candidatus Bathyarchaeia archaeon]
MSAQQKLDAINLIISLKMVELEALMSRKAQLESQIPKQTEKIEVKGE